MKHDLPNCTLSYQVFGQGQPVLVLHGGYLDHRHMVDAFEPIFDQHGDWKRVYVDLPGHGDSPVDGSVTTHDQVLDILLRFWDEVLDGQNLLLAGESRGGFLARGLVHKRSDKVDGLLLIVPARCAAADRSALPVPVTLVRADELRPGLPSDELSRFDRLVVQNRDILTKIRSLKIPALKMADPSHQESIMENYRFSFRYGSSGTTLYPSDAGLVGAAGLGRRLPGQPTARRALSSGHRSPSGPRRATAWPGSSPRCSAPSWPTGLSASRPSNRLAVESHMG